MVATNVPPRAPLDGPLPTLVSNDSLCSPMKSRDSERASKVRGGLVEALDGDIELDRLPVRGKDHHLGGGCGAELAQEGRVDGEGRCAARRLAALIGQFALARLFRLQFDPGWDRDAGSASATA